MSRPPVIRTKAEVTAKLSLLEVCVGVVVSLYDGSDIAVCIYCNDST